MSCLFPTYHKLKPLSTRYRYPLIQIATNIKEVGEEVEDKRYIFFI